MRTMCRGDNLATFMCRFSKSPGRLGIVEPSLGLYSDTFTFTYKPEFSVIWAWFMQSTLLPLIFFSHLLYWVRWYLKARYSTTGSIHFAEHKAKRQTNPHDIRLFRKEESIFCTLIMECVVCTHDTWYKVQKHSFSRSRRHVIIRTESDR